MKQIRKIFSGAVPTPSFWPIRNWKPRSSEELTTENHELDQMDAEMQGSLAGLSPQMRADLKKLSESDHPRDAEMALIDYVISKDHTPQLRKESRDGTGRTERRMENTFWWVSAIPAMIVLYLIFSWLYQGFWHIH